MASDDFNDRYEAEISAIFTRFPSFQKVGGAAYKPGIGGIEEWDRVAGHPHRNFVSVHVAGTNGKGSVSHLIASVLASAGYKVGLYTSPHLLDFRERMKICDGAAARAEYISKESVYDFLMKWKQYFVDNSLSFFEITTMMAFEWFSREKVDFAVIETGLGGRLDSTNIILPALSVITNIGLDHCDMLGHTRDKIAFEKGGIIKNNVPVVIGEDDEEVSEVFDSIAEKCSAPLFDAAEMFPYDSPEMKSYLEDMDLKGIYQKNNLSTAMAALSVLESFGVLETHISDGALHDGIANAAYKMRFLGRWQREQCGESVVISDIGHNAHGLRYNFRQLEELFRSNPDKEPVVILGFVSDKDIDSALELAPHIPGRKIRFILTNASSPRSMPCAELMEHFVRIQSDRISVGDYSAETSSSVEKAVSSVLGSPAVIYVGGSTFVVAEALPLLMKE